MKIILTIFAALLCASTLAYDLTPAAARVDVPVDQLNGVKDQLMKTLLDKIEALDIPNVNVSKKILFFDVDLSIEDIKVDFITANFFLSEFDFKKPNTIAFTSYMQQLNVSFNLSVKFFKTFNLGSVVARMSKTPLSLDIELDTTSDKKFSAQIKNLDVKFGPLDLTLGDKQSEGIDILEMLIQMVGNHILKKDGAEVLGGLEGKVNEMLKTKLGDMSTEYPVPGTDLVIDFSPAGTPNVRSGILQIGLDLSVYKKGEQPIPIKPTTPLPAYDPKQKGIAIHVSEELVNVDLAAILQNVALKVLVTQKMIPDTVNVEFNTTYFQPLLPNLAKEKPDTDLDLSITPGKSLDISFNSQDQSVDINVDIDIAFVLTETKEEYITLNTNESGKLRFTSGLDSLFVYAQSIVMNSLEADSDRIKAGDISIHQANQAFNYIMLIVAQAADSQVLAKLPLAVPVLDQIQINDYQAEVADKALSLYLNFAVEK